MLTYKEVSKVLIKNGFVLKRIRGSHHTYKHDDGRITIVPKHKEIKIGTLKEIERQSGIKF